MRKRVLIIHAHPEEKSFCSAIKNATERYFIDNGAEVKISSLYEMGFDPIGGASDFTQLNNPEFFKYQLEQVNAFEKNLFQEPLKSEMEKLDWCDTLIFNFPLWWFGLPAILKGWVDRVFAMGFAYGNGKGVYENGTFKDKLAFITMTTGGPEVAYGVNGKNGILSEILYPIHHGMFYFVGMKVITPFISFAPARVEEAERKAELLRLENFLKDIDNCEPMY